LRHILVSREAAGLEDDRAGGAVTDLSLPILQLILASGVTLDWKTVLLS
jgi:hypothetical protein